MAHTLTHPVKEAVRPSQHAPQSRATLVLGVAGAVLLWAALPPLSWTPLAWLAPVPWLLLVRREQLEGRRPYRTLWLVGFGFWLLAVHWLRLPHPATHFGWLALAFYLAFYLPVFVGLARVAVHRLHVPLVLAAPVVWTGLELARAHLLSGFLMAALAHTQTGWLRLIQISDLAGAYAVGFVMVLASAAVAQALPLRGERAARWPLLVGAAALGATLLYGHARLAEESAQPGPRVALIQGSIDADWKADPGKSQRIFDEYFGLSRQAVAASDGQLDLIVWPETMYRQALYGVAQDFEPPADLARSYHEADENTRSHIASMAEALKTPLLLGLDAVELTADGPAAFNSAVGVTEDGKIVGLYRKMHRVMFGEYVPLAKTFPQLYRLTPLRNGLEAGTAPAAFELGGVRYGPNICYESTVPHVIRQHVTTLAAAGQKPDVLVNLTNDAWFWGSSELDMHLACAVFRAIETRTPFLIAANGGLSAQIDGSGRILQESPRRQTDFILADVQFDRRRSLYLAIGDLPAGICLVGCVALAGVGLWDWRKRQAR